MNEEHIKTLMELRTTGDVSDWRALETALDAGIDALTQQQANHAALKEQVAEAHRQPGDEQPLENIRRVADMLRKPLQTGRWWHVYRVGRLNYRVGSGAYGWLYTGNHKTWWWTRKGAQRIADKLNAEEAIAFRGLAYMGKAP